MADLRTRSLPAGDVAPGGVNLPRCDTRQAPDLTLAPARTRTSPPNGWNPVTRRTWIGSPPRTSPGWRRVAAFAVDYGVILAYLGLLALLGVLGRAVGVLPTEVTTPDARVAAQLVGIAVLTLPVTLWFAGWEAGPGRATPGKRVLGLRVVTTGGERLGWPRSLLRTALKFTVPWELAHTAVWNLLAWPGDGGSVVDMVLLGVANAVIVVDLVSLFVGTRRTPYDRIAGTVIATTG